MPHEQGYFFNGIKGTLGASDMAGQLRIQKVDDRQKLSGQLLSHTLRIQDLPVSPSASQTARDTGETATSPQPSTGILSPLPFDLDLDLNVDQCLFGETELGSIALTTSVNQTHAEVHSARLKSFGGTVDARFEAQLNAPHPQSRLEAKVRSLNYGRAIRDFGMGMNVKGMTDFDVTATSSGGTWQELLKTLTVNLQIGKTTLGLSSSISEVPPPVALRRGSLRVSNGGPVKMIAQGVYREREFGLRLTTASPAELVTGKMSWPVSFTAQAAGALLQVKGAVDAGSSDLPAAVTVSLKGRRLNELDPILPAVGPYFLKAQVIKEGGRFEISDFQSRFGNSDLSGALEVDLQKSNPHLMGLLTSQQIHVAELSTPGDIGIPSEAMRAIDFDFNIAIGQLRTGNMDVAGLAFTANLHGGRLMIPSFQGTLLDQKSSYGNFQGDLTLDASGAIPTLSGGVSVDHVRYEHLFKGVRFVNLSENVVNLDVRFSSEGGTIFSMLDRSTLSLESRKLRVEFNRKANDQDPVQILSNLKAESADGGSFRLHADGIFQDTPFKLHSLTGHPGQLRREQGLWPLDVVLEVPHTRLELQGNLPLPPTFDEFTFQVLLKGNNLRDLNFLTASNFPEGGPVSLKAVLTRTPVGFHVTDMEGTLGESRLQSDITVMTKGDRPRVRGKIIAESLVLGTLKHAPVDTPNKKERSILGGVAKSVKDIGSDVIDTVTDTLGMGREQKAPGVRAIPDFVIPVEPLRAFDLFLDVDIQHMKKGDAELGHATFQVSLHDGFLVVQPLAGRLWEGKFEGKLVFDGKNYVPTLSATLDIQGLDYGRVAETFGRTDFVKGQSHSIRLTVKSRGETLHEVLERAGGRLDLVDGPLQLATRYIDLWAADLITTALTTAWQSQPLTKLNCMVGYFDIEEGVLKSDAILLDTSRLTIAGLGKINLGNETLDLVLTPRPKDPSLFSLAHTVRITGPLSDPDVTSDKFRIAESGGWGLLGLVNPTGWIIAIPQIAGTTVGTMKQNPCVEALKSREHTVQALDEIKGGLWRRLKRIFSKSGETSDRFPDNQE
jgi:uncharacterized protein involved in outer membrane biogenesis